MLPSFPDAQQAQIIRANQRDLFHVLSLREQTESVVRSWIGTRRLTRWVPEIDLFVKVVYYGLTTGRALQTLGEEYTNIWQHSSRGRRLARVALVLLPALPHYILERVGSRGPYASALAKATLTIDVLAEVNLAVFYLRGVYYDLAKRLVGARYISSTPANPHARPPSYSLLGILLGIRILHRLVSFVGPHLSPQQDPNAPAPTLSTADSATFLDDRPISALASAPAPDAGTWLAPSAGASARTCTLCLDERTHAAATECGHVFCWDCIFGWGREKAECPLCRQALNLTRLLPLYNI